VNPLALNSQHFGGACPAAQKTRFRLYTLQGKAIALMSPCLMRRITQIPAYASMFRDRIDRVSLLQINHDRNSYRNSSPFREIREAMVAIFSPEAGLGGLCTIAQNGQG
jgi:hypothetical protein